MQQGPEQGLRCPGPCPPDLHSSLVTASFRLVPSLSPPEQTFGCTSRQTGGHTPTHGPRDTNMLPDVHTDTQKQSQQGGGWEAQGWRAARAQDGGALCRSGADLLIQLEGA